MTSFIMNIYFSCRYTPIIDEAMKLANAPSIPCVVYNRNLGSLADKAPNLEVSMKQVHVLNWAESAEKSAIHDCVDVEANDPLYILYTSGTTGRFNPCSGGFFFIKTSELLVISKENGQIFF